MAACQSGIAIYRNPWTLSAAYDDLTQPITANCLLSIISGREYLREPARRAAQRLSDLLKEAIPLSFQHGHPQNEAALQDAVSSILTASRADFEAEFPFVRFALASSKPDHYLKGADVWVEEKYIRDGTTPSKVSEGILADIGKYPEQVFKLFVVYDPHHAIARSSTLQHDIESKGNCQVCIVR
jgi:hypothetical protein